MIFTLLSQTNKVCKPFSLTELYHKSLQMQGGLFYGIFQQRSWCLQTLVVALGAGLGIWGVINLLEGYGQDNPASNAHVR